MASGHFQTGMYLVFEHLSIFRSVKNGPSAVLRSSSTAAAGKKLSCVAWSTKFRAAPDYALSTGFD